MYIYIYTYYIYICIYIVKLFFVLITYTLLRGEMKGFREKY